MQCVGVGLQLPMSFWSVLALSHRARHCSYNSNQRGHHHRCSRCWSFCCLDSRRLLCSSLVQQTQLMEHRSPCMGWKGCTILVMPQWQRLNCLPHQSDTLVADSRSPRRRSITSLLSNPFHFP